MNIDPLLQPLTVRGVTFANRVVMSPMTRNFSPNGVPGDDVAAYYRRRAEGGAAAILTEAVCVEHPGAVVTPGWASTARPTCGVMRRWPVGGTW